MDRESVEELVALEDVQRVVISSCPPLEPVEIELDDVLGLVLAEDVHARDDLPPFANTAMDGYAVRAEDTQAAPVELSVIGVLRAGSAPTLTVGPGTAIQIMTGAPMPPGADGIAIVERTQPGSSDGKVRILDKVSPGA
jgi:molybdopterin molybdotransferase